MKCPNCGADNWTLYAKQNAYHEGGLTVTCDGIRGQDVCLWSIHLTKEQVITAAFLAVRQGAPGCALDCHTWEHHHRPGCPNDRAASKEVA